MPYIDCFGKIQEDLNIEIYEVYRYNVNYSQLPLYRTRI